LARKNILAQNCSQIARQENSLGRHDSRFRPKIRVTYKQYQSLAQSRDQENRPSGRESANFG
jgi:hypothetical protein